MKEVINLLGHKAKDLLTGIEGVVDTVSQSLHGVPRVTMAILSEDKGKTPEYHSVDFPQVEDLGPVSGVIVEDHGEPKFDLGVVVSDPVRGLEGTVTSHCYHVNGCMRAHVQPAYDKKNGVQPPPFWEYEDQLEAAKGLLGKEKPSTTKPSKRTTGGPASHSCPARR